MDEGNVGEDRPASWLGKALRVTGEFYRFHTGERVSELISDDFRQRYREAADVALMMNRLREERRRVGFVPVSFADYIHGLANAAGISLTRLLDSRGVADLTRIDHGSARAVARLAQVLEMSLRETLVHVRIGIIGQSDPALVSMLVARRRQSEARDSRAEEYESILHELERDCDPLVRRELRSVEIAIRVVFAGTDTALI